MNFMTASYFLLWALVLSLTAFVITLSRKPKRILPATHTGLPVGEAFPAFKAQSVVENLPFRVEDPEGKATIVLFSSELCPICRTIYPLLPVAEKKHNINFQVFMEPQHAGDTTGIINMINEKSITAPVYELTDAIKKEARLVALPFAYYLSRDGKVLSKGVVVHLDDFGLLIEQGRRAAMKKSISTPNEVKMPQTG